MYVQDGLASSLEKIGLVLSVSEKPTQALRACQEAMAIREKLSKTQATHIFMRGLLAESHCVLGRVHRRAGQPAEAAASFRSALAIVEQLPTLTPRNHYDLACCHAQLAGVAADAGSGLTPEQRVTEADKPWRPCSRPSPVASTPLAYCSPMLPSSRSDRGKISRSW
jgi:hypothetical protein